jgi:hypothetical protein
MPAPVARQMKRPRATPIQTCAVIAIRIVLGGRGERDALVYIVF